MANKTILITVPDSKVAKVLEGFLSLYPNRELNRDETPKYTDAQWLEEKIRRILVREVRRGLQKKANKDALINKDDESVIIESIKE